MNLVFLISPLIFSLFLCSLFIFLLFNLFRYFYLVFLIFLLFLTVSTCLGWPCLPPWLGGGVWERVRVAKWGPFLSELHGYGGILELAGGFGGFGESVSQSAAQTLLLPRMSPG